MIRSVSSKSSGSDGAGSNPGDAVGHLAELESKGEAATKWAMGEAKVKTSTIDTCNLKSCHVLYHGLPLRSVYTHMDDQGRPEVTTFIK